MKLGEKVGIVCDHTLIEEARAIRSTLESFRLRADLHRLVQRRQAADFFARTARDYEFLVLCAHGDEERIKLEVIEPKPDNPELGEMVGYLLKPATIPDQLSASRERWSRRRAARAWSRSGRPSSRPDAGRTTGRPATAT